MAKNLTQTEAKIARPARRNAFRDRNWEVLFVSFIFLVSLLATIGMVLISVFDPKNTDNQFRIVPAASIMVMVELWLVFSLPFYSKISFWGGIIFLATYLFFAVPFVYLGLLPGVLGVGIGVFSVVALLCGLVLFRQRERFLRRATPAADEQNR